LDNEREAKIVAQEAEIRVLNDEKAKLNAKLKEQQAKIDALLLQLSSAKDEATRLSLQKQLAEAREAQNKARAGGGAKPCNCAPADPLCSCL
jgi:colicin import membrane protein